MRLQRFWTALSIAVLMSSATVTAAMGAPASATATVDAASGECPVLAASPWQLPYSPYTKGTQYDVAAHGISCVKADGYIKKLVMHKVGHGLTPTVRGGPPGWRCTGSKSKKGLAYTGQCSKSRSTLSGPYFAWSVG
jgi:hypothetical protein